MSHPASYPNPWLWNGEPFEEEHIGDHYGFVYLITNKTSGRRYIGRKYFYSKRKSRVLMSDWKNYWGSSKELLADIEALGQEVFLREILSLHYTKGQVNYNEIKIQFKYDVLEALNEDGSRAFYNANIMSRYFVQTPESIEKHRKKMKGRPLSPLHKRNVQAACRRRTGTHLSEATKIKIGQANSGRKRTSETREKMSAKKRGKIPHNAIPVELNGVTYESLSAASRILGRKTKTIKKMMVGISVKAKSEN